MGWWAGPPEPPIDMDRLVDIQFRLDEYDELSTIEDVTSLFVGLLSGLYSEPLPEADGAPRPEPPAPTCPELISGVESLGGVGGKLKR